MIRWLILGMAIVTELAATLSLKAALDHPGWYAVVVPGYVLSFALLGAALRHGMQIGIAYGIWVAGGVSATAILAAVLYDEPLTGPMIIGIALMIVGVLAVELGSHPIEDAAPATSEETLR
jgi:small multidrug resistance pump